VVTHCEEIQEAAPNLGGFHDVVLGGNSNGLAERFLIGQAERLTELRFPLGHSSS
jgi:hypothetical protein